MENSSGSPRFPWWRTFPAIRKKRNQNPRSVSVSLFIFSNYAIIHWFSSSNAKEKNSHFKIHVRRLKGHFLRPPHIGYIWGGSNSNKNPKISFFKRKIAFSNFLNHFYFPKIQRISKDFKTRFSSLKT